MDVITAFSALVIMEVFSLDGTPQVRVDYPIPSRIERCILDGVELVTSIELAGSFIEARCRYARIPEKTTFDPASAALKLRLCGDQFRKYILDPEKLCSKQ